MVFLWIVILQSCVGLPVALASLIYVNFLPWFIVSQCCQCRMLGKARLHEVQIEIDRSTGTEANRHIGRDFYTWYQDKIQGKISFKNDIICNKYTPHMSDTLMKHENYVYDSLGNTHPWRLTETYSGCHITQPIQHITPCCQGPWPN